MTSPISTDEFPAMADTIRVLAAEMVEAANAGHPGMPMGMADVATVLFSKFLKFDIADTTWPDRDRFVLSAGHGSALLYALLHLLGEPEMTREQLLKFRQLGSLTPGHPEHGHTKGVETTTGPLGQGFGNAVGMAMAEAHLAARFGSDLVDHRTWVIAGDGCLMEGISQEALALAGRLRLAKLTVLWDDNNVTIDGPVTLSDRTDQLARFGASGWATTQIDGHDYEQIERALAWAVEQDRPTLIACRTKIGRGAPNLEGHHKTHGSPLGAAEVAALRERLGFNGPVMTPPEKPLAAWRSLDSKGSGARRAWQDRLASSPHKADFEAAHSGHAGPAAFAALDGAIAKAVETKSGVATRVASGEALTALYPAQDNLFGGSCDLTGSNNTRIAGMETFDHPTYAGRYVNYGIREHGAAAALNGMALHGGMIPYVGCFLVFSDYCRPSLRLAALTHLGVIHVMTHDSIGVGEDGPTHQPVEHFAALRSMPNLFFFRPADAVETCASWRAALELRNAPSILALSRQGAPAVGLGLDAAEKVGRGAYELAPASGRAEVTLFAAGTEVIVALKAREQLQAEGIGTRVVSAPCWALFERQSPAYQAQVLGDTPINAAVEAGVRFGWDRFIGRDGLFIGMKGYGASGKQNELFAHFEITPDAVVRAVKARREA
jgi:transketolase